MLKTKQAVLCWNYFQTDDEFRNTELDACLEGNIKTDVIDTILIALDDKINMADFKSKFPHKKLQVVEWRERPTFQKWFKYIAANIEDRCLVIIANSDIYFSDSTVEMMKEQLGENDSLALTRYDTKTLEEEDLLNAKRFWHSFGYSTDSWCFVTPLKTKLLDKGNFHLGVMGCDGRINSDISRSGYKVRNRCKTFKTYHLHTKRLARTSKKRISRPWKHVLQTY